MAFDHNPEDAFITGGDLRCHVVSHLHLVGRIFATIAVTAVDHDARRDAGLREIFGRAIDVAGIVIWLFTAVQDDMAILIARSGKDRKSTRLNSITVPSRMPSSA